MKYPASVTVVEVGPRDGFQSVKDWIETADKIQICRGLLDAGLPMMEYTSFISPKAIPQMRDAEEVSAALLDIPGAADRLYALVANKRGADRAWAAGVKKVAMVISASPDHNRSNVNKTPAQSLEELSATIDAYPHLHIKLDLATAFGCPFRGEVSMEEITFVLDGAVRAGIRDICLCDTIGVGMPEQVRYIFERLQERYVWEQVQWSVHLHNTRGMAMANTLAAMEAGITRFETAVAGLGGCPFAPGASGNMATEDLVYFLNEAGISSGVDLDRVIQVSEGIAGKIGCRDSKINATTVHKIFPKT